MNPNIDPAELGKFEASASRWWDAGGEFKPLHIINPLRLDYIDERAPLSGRRVLDAGCGGGLLSEAMAKRGAAVTGIDPGRTAIEVAQLHARESQLDITYLCTDTGQLADEQPGQYDSVTCMELLEHVPDPAALVRACAQLAKPGGDVFFSTINRTPKAWLLAVVGAEYVLRLLPRGTHRYEKLIRPGELGRWCERAGITVRDITGLHYNPCSETFALGPGVDVNYIAYATAPAPA